MAITDTCKGLYLFGTDFATSKAAVLGTSGGNLTYTAGPGGVAYGSNYVDLKQGSYFTAPYNSTPRDRTTIIVGLGPFYELCYDSGTYRFPPTTRKAAAMTYSDKHIVDWSPGGYMRTLDGGGHMIYSPGSGAANLTFPANPYSPAPDIVAYRDGSFTIMPQIMVLGHGPDGTGVYGGYTCGRNMTWGADNTAYSGSALSASPSRFGDMDGADANSHTILLGVAEYPFLSKYNALLAASDLVTRLEARGWTGLFHNPVTAE